ncbi:hypothetical protein DN730_08105 [Marinomonas piezotolerans]|uniref:Uncharacterized protein n=1 Tax=Marinomonas piezotolerans TaxID=2213058 RepID=A0A370U9A0_9GAMM|nr:hypothetical protein [Marinomonas piezotolerans]RDL44357.1 hypothetical protein DN730_08105 [Marinomonas piezotolerans]
MTVNTDQLEQEADELFARRNQAPDKSDTAKDESEQTEQEQAEQTPPEQQDTAETQAERTPEVIAEERIKNAQALMTKATQEAAALRRENAQLKEQMEALQANPSEGESNAPEVGSLEDLMEEYPELVGPLVQRLNQLEGKINGIETVSQKSKEDAALEAHWDTINQAHPDHMEIAQEPDFQGWVARQPPVMQQIAQNGSAQDVIYLLDQYKATISKGTSQNKKVDQAKELADKVPRTQQKPTTSLKPSFTREQIAKMSPEQFSKYEAEIDEAMARGEIN